VIKWWLIDWLFTVLRPAQEYFTYMETSPFILYPEFLALPAKYLRQRLTILQESCKMAKFLKYNKLATSVVKIHLNTSITRRCQTFVRFNNRWIFFNRRFLKFDYTENQWWIQKSASIIISNQRYNQLDCPTFSS
jgi:hypothetical protein